MRRSVLALAAALTALVFTSSAQAITISFGVAPLGGTPAYTGATLNTSTAFDFGGGTYQVNQIGVGDQSGLALNATVTLTNITYGAGNAGALTANLVKEWTTVAGTFTETLTSFIANRATANALTLTLIGTLTGPGIVGSQA